MNFYRDIFYSEAAKEFIEEIKKAVINLHRPSEEIILDEIQLCELLHISKRHAADLRKEGILKYSKVGGKIYYLLSDVLEMIKKHRIENPFYNSKFKL